VLTDPFGGQRDLQARVFRHVSDAFAEDPVRILRVARFAARLPEFSVAPETVALMRRMVEEGEVDALVAERVWQELARGLMENTPSRMFAVLRDCGALARLLPELDAHAALMAMLDRAAAHKLALPQRFAILTHGLQAAPRIDAVCARLKVPSDCRDLAVMTARELAAIGRAGALSAHELVSLCERCDGFRKPQRLVQMGECAALLLPDPGPVQHLLGALGAARAVDAGQVAQQCGAAKAGIAQAVHAARVAAVAHQQQASAKR